MDIKVTINREPCWLLEAVELAFALVNKIPAERLTAPGEYCIPVSEVEKYLAYARQALEPQMGRLQFYFHAVPLEGQSMRDSCLACALLYTTMEVRCSDPAEMAQASIDAWNRFRAEGFRIDDMNGFSLGLGTPETEDFVSLSAELAGLPVPQSYQVELAEVLSDYAFHVRSLVQLLEPVTRWLSQQMAPWVEKAAALLDSWEEFFHQHTPSELLKHRGGFLHENLCGFHMAIRYLSPRVAPAKVSEEVRIHMGAALNVGLEPSPAPRKPEEWECKVLQLLSNPSRIAMLRMMMEQSMSVQMVAKALNLNPGAVSRDINGLNEARLLRQEIRDGRSFYRTNPKTVAQVTEHVSQYIIQG